MYTCKHPPLPLALWEAFSGEGESLNISRKTPEPLEMIMKASVQWSCSLNLSCLYTSLQYLRPNPLLDRSPPRNEAHPSEQSSSLPVALGLALFKALLIGVRTWNVLTITLDLQKHHLPVRAVLLINSELFHHREESLIPPEGWEVCWVSQKVCLGFFITSYGKTQTNILANIFSPYKDQAKGSLKALAFDNLIQLHREVLFTFLIVRPNLGLPHCRQILYHLSHQGSPRPQNKANEIKD